ncbi:ATP-binding protein [Siminovitchia sp. 179-K 8D1 HS]|uniref:ATP-binding protein n=1 Tax=Siminovitchia sp. 179-K 8D1 HS TaxID=3142385 RepID=UPI0039A0BE77
MIKKIKIKDIATYDSEGIEIEMNKINYIYGSNGTGKTTISEFLRNSQRFHSCRIEWIQNSSDYDLFVYNRHFVQENFNVYNEIKGIFTLGKESADILKQIDEKTKDIKKHNDRIETIKDHIKEKEDRLKSLKDDFMEKCWELKTKYDTIFQEAFIGLRAQKKKFMEKCLVEAKNNDGEIYTYEKLIKRAESVFKGSQEKINIIPNVDYDKLFEENQIFKTIIIGKKDIDIAKLISNLNISDWVQQGHNHIEYTNGICPFCQQELPVAFKEKLDEYFDESYTQQIQYLNSSIEKYKRETIGIIEKCRLLKDEDIPFINKEKITALFEILNTTYRENIQLLDKKRKEPSRIVELSSISNCLEQINAEIEMANTQISELNRIIENIKEEKVKLIKDIWRFVIEENKKNYENYMSNFKIESRALKGMNQNKEKQKIYRNKLQQEVIGLQNELTSVLPSINEINSLLKSFGFTNFQLAESDEKGNYKIVRENGDNANETLSEGEKTFITFLYFYQLINGSNDQNKVNTERIIVIDDPISSLDSNILFIVSNLINSLKKKVRMDDSNFKQLIVLTHNVYFHKEISFNKGKSNQKLHDETFWILRKTNNISYIQKYIENPIKNSYELLWKELKENPNSITTPNIMRRILENYFKFFGNIDVNEIVECFPEEEKVVCNSLLSWANDGSHHIYDDLYVDSNQEINRIYFDVFSRIFINFNHGSHFNMMMGNFEYTLEAPVSDKVAGQIQEVMDQTAVSVE